MKKEKFFLSVSMLSRICVGVVSLFVLARNLGPANYGFIATVVAYSSILALLTDFGFGIQALRDIGAEPGRAGSLIAACIRVKNVLVAVATAIALVVLSLLKLPQELFVASLMIYGSIIVMSYGDLAVTALRGIGRYDIEAYAVIAGAASFAVILTGAALTKPDLVVLSAALFSARIVQTVLCFAAVMAFVRLGNCVFGRLVDIVRFAHQSSGIALDTVLTVLSGQLDTIFVSGLLGLHAAGTYQVASRLANYMLLPLQVLAGVYMPRLAAGHVNGDSAPHKLERQMVLEFSGIGLGLGVVFVVFAPILTPIAFSGDYVVPLEVWAGFAILFFLKSCVAALGVALVARRGVAYRVIGQAAGVLVVLAGLRIFLPVYGMVAAPVVMTAGTLLTAGIYIWTLTLLRRRMAALQPVDAGLVKE